MDRGFIETCTRVKIKELKVHGQMAEYFSKCQNYAANFQQVFIYSLKRSNTCERPILLRKWSMTNCYFQLYGRMYNSPILLVIADLHIIPSRLFL